MQKTVNVAVDRYKMNTKYHKRIRYTRKFMAHDEEEVCNMGDLVSDDAKIRHTSAAQEEPWFVFSRNLTCYIISTQNLLASIAILRRLKLYPIVADLVTNTFVFMKLYVPRELCKEYKK